MKGSVKGFAQFAIYRQPSPDERRRKEAEDLADLLRQLAGFVKLDDVQFGQPPHEPDFIFHHQGKRIGAELTDLDPKVFGKHGYLERGKHKTWRAEIEPDETPQEHNWGVYSLRESLAAFKAQLDGKRKKARYWLNYFPQRWLLMHVAGGSPFSQIFTCKEWQTVPGKEKEVAEYLAKSTHGVYSICKEIEPFDYVILFMQDDFLAFPANAANPRKLPVPGDEILKLGAQASDRFLEWKKESRTVVIRVG